MRPKTLLLAAAALPLLAACPPAEPQPTTVSATVQLRGAVTEDIAGRASAAQSPGTVSTYVNVGGEGSGAYANLYLVLDESPVAGASYGWDDLGSTAGFGHVLRRVGTAITHEGWNAAYCACTSAGSASLALTSVEKVTDEAGAPWFLLHGTADAVLPSTPDGTGTVTFHAEF